jgi:hypothetical protein
MAWTHRLGTRQNSAMDVRPGIGPGETEVGVSFRLNLFFEQYLHPVRGLDLDNPVCPVRAWPLYGHLESET